MSTYLSIYLRDRCPNPAMFPVRVGPGGIGDPSRYAGPPAAAHEHHREGRAPRLPARGAVLALLGSVCVFQPQRLRNGGGGGSSWAVLFAFGRSAKKTMMRRFAHVVSKHMGAPPLWNRREPRACSARCDRSRCGVESDGRWLCRERSRRFARECARRRLPQQASCQCLIGGRVTWRWALVLLNNELEFRSGGQTWPGFTSQILDLDERSRFRQVAEPNREVRSSPKT